jgi:outer membrane protein TolC
MVYGPRRLLLLVAPAWLCLSLPARAQDAAALPSITLRDALRGAQTRAPSVVVAEAARALAEAERAPTTAAYFPALTIGGDAGYTFDNSPPSALTRLLLPDTPRIDSRSLIAKGEVALEWTALDWSRGARADAAEAAARAQVFTAAAARHDALLLAAERYIQSAAANALAKDAELALARRSEQERAIGELVRTGTRSPLDLERAKIETLSARYELAARQRDELAACAALAAAIGRPATQPVCARRGDLAVFEPAPSQDNALSGRSTRPELEARAALVDARREEYDAAIAARLPTVGLAGHAELSYLDVRKGEGVDGHQYGGSALVTVRWSGLDPAIWSQAAPADAAIAHARSEWDAERQAIASEAVAASHAVLRAKIELDRAVAVMRAAETARDAQNGRYRAGLASMLELLDSEDLAQQASRASIEAERDQQLASARLLWATGRIATLTP